VGIYVDAVSNHMTAQRVARQRRHGVHEYDYRELYGAADFHMPACTIAGSDYQDAADRVRTCELLGLADLDAASERVFDRIAGYLTSLVDAGVPASHRHTAKHARRPRRDLGRVPASRTFLG
jgi:hypothetical protein